MQKRNWDHRGYKIYKAARTNKHKEQAIRIWDSKKVDLIVVFRNSYGEQIILMFQIKSTRKSHFKFAIRLKYRHIGSLLIRESYTPERTTGFVSRVFKKLIDAQRPDIPIDKL